MRRLIIASILFAVGCLAMPAAQVTSRVQFVFSSDAHYGITRPTFRGRTTVDAREVNQALVSAINSLDGRSFPDDGGIGGGEPVGPVDFLAETGDIANRMEVDQGRQVQSAAVSFRQFADDYIDGLRLRTRSGERTPVYMVPGNHDASNAVGFYRMMTPVLDPGSILEIYNRMMRPSRPLTAAQFDYQRDRVHYSRDIDGIHFQFISIWPDSSQRAWMEQDLARVPASTPVFVFAHDQVESEAKHFMNPKGHHDVNETDRFENLLSDPLEEGDVSAPTVAEERALEAFLRRHPNVTAYFHGNSNWTQFYDYVGPDHTVALHAFRVDSPMKGRFSLPDETKLAFEVATIDTATGRLTVREVLWNTTRSAAPVAWGASTTVALSPRHP